MNNNQNFDPMTGQPLNNNQNFDPMTGQPLNNNQNQNPTPGADVNNNQNFDPMTGQPLNNNSNLQNVVPPKKSNTKKIIFIIVGIAVGFLLLGALIFFIVLGFSDKLVCKSQYGTITIMYDDKTIVGYTATGILTYDLDAQKAYAEQIGIDNYINQLTYNFNRDFGGKCERK